MENIFEQYESEVRSYCRNYPVVFEYAKNEFMRDEAGREYIDFFCGAGALNYGHNNDYIKEKLIDYLKEDRIIHSLDMYTTAKRDFIEVFGGKIIWESPQPVTFKMSKEIREGRIDAFESYLVDQYGYNRLADF